MSKYRYLSEDHWLVRNRYQVLFFTLVASILLPGFFPVDVRMNWISPITDISILIAGLLIIQKLKTTAIYIALFGIVGIVLNLFEGYTGLLGLLVFATFIGILTYELFIDLTKKKVISLKDVVGALDGYMLIGLIGTFIFLIINTAYHGAFSNLSDGRGSGMELLYFSYITMLTIGYGDITPLIPASRGAVIMLGMTGQFYLVVVIATFVGKFLMNPNEK